MGCGSRARLAPGRRFAALVLPQSTVGEWSSTSSGKSISPQFGRELELIMLNSAVTHCNRDPYGKATNN